MQNLNESLRKYLEKEDGATAVEYAVLLALIIAVCIFVIWGLGLQVQNSYRDFNAAFANTTK